MPITSILIDTGLSLCGRLVPLSFDQASQLHGVFAPHSLTFFKLVISFALCQGAAVVAKPRNVNAPYHFGASDHGHVTHAGRFAKLRKSSPSSPDKFTQDAHLINRILFAVLLAHVLDICPRHAWRVNA